MKKTLLLIFVLSLIAGFMWLGCEMEPSQVTGPDVGLEQAAKVALPDVAVERLIAVQEKHTVSLMAIEGIVGTIVEVGIGNRPVVPDDQIKPAVAVQVGSDDRCRIICCIARQGRHRVGTGLGAKVEPVDLGMIADHRIEAAVVVEITQHEGLRVVAFIAKEIGGKSAVGVLDIKTVSLPPAPDRAQIADGDIQPPVVVDITERHG